MTLDEGDVNGFRGTAAGKKAIRNNKKRGSNKSGNKREDPSLSFQPSVGYEVGKPCDYVSAFCAGGDATLSQLVVLARDSRVD